MLIPLPFATTDDLSKRWRTLTSTEEGIATVLLGDASNLIVSEYPSANYADDDDLYTQGVLAAALTRITCAMVKRAMLAPTDQPPMTQMSMTAGPFGQSATLANPTGDLYLTKSERASLSGDQQSAFTVPMWDLEDVPAGSINDPYWDLEDNLSDEPPVPITGPVP
jgi:hypothetical protein